MSIYVRKTNNQKMLWSAKRKAEWSLRIRREIKNKTWYKQTPKQISEARVNGRNRAKENATEFWASTKLRERKNPHTQDLLTVCLEEDTIEEISKMISLLNKYAGTNLTVKEFVSQSVKKEMRNILALKKLQTRD